MKRSTALTLLLVSLALTGCGSPPGAEPIALRSDAGPMDLSVMSFNIRYGTARDGDNAWPHRRERVIDVIRRHAPDVIGVQEALRFQLDEIRAALDPEYGEIGVGRDDGVEAGEYAAILYRAERFLVTESGTRWFSDTPWEPGSMSWGNRIPRIVTHARLHDAARGQSLYVYNVHLDHQSQPSRERSVEDLLASIAIRDEPETAVIVMGDFNAGEKSPEIRAMESLVDTFRTLRPDAKHVGTFNGFEGRTSGERIDYVFVSPEIEVLEAAIVRDHAGGRYPSDHFPVKARVRIGER